MRDIISKSVIRNKEGEVGTTETDPIKLSLIHWSVKGFQTRSRWAPQAGSIMLRASVIIDETSHLTRMLPKSRSSPSVAVIR